MALDLATIVKQLTDSGIIAPGKLENFVPPKADPKTVEGLISELVKQNQLTAFQAQQVKVGKARSLILGAYTILDKIGAGGMGQVFKALHRRMDRIVAIKMLPTAMMKDAAAAARFEREVRAAAKLEHPNIVTAYDADQANGVHFLVMQFVDGQDLSALVKKNGPFPVAKAVNFVLQAARGLEFAHKKGVVHRDIKPANLLLDNEGTVKILDMGLARIDQGDGEAQAELTGTGAVMGTVDYMSPEQAFNTHNADARADIYSLGCSLYYLIAGKAMYAGDSVMEKLLGHREKPIPSLRNVQPDISEQVQAVFSKMVAKKVEDRYQTMTEVLAALEQCSSGQSTFVSGPPSQTVNLDNSALTFLKDIPAQTTFQAKASKKAAPSKSATGNKKFIYGAVGAAVLGLAILAGVIISLKSGDDNLIVEVNEPDAVVTISSEQGKVEVTRKTDKTPLSISVDPGKHRLRVEKDGFQFLTKDFMVEAEGKTTLRARMVPVRVAANAGQPSKPWNTPAFQQWMKSVAALPAEKQVEAVSKKLMELNPGFDGKMTPKIDQGVVTGLSFITDNVTDISPVRALTGLRFLTCGGSEPGAKPNGKLVDLSPLQGMALTKLHFGGTPVSDLTPLKELPLTDLLCNSTKVTDLTPLRGMPLTKLAFLNTRVRDLSPLEGMPLLSLTCINTYISDLSPLQGMPLNNLNCGGTNSKVSDLSPLEGCKSLTSLSIRGIKVTRATVAALQKALPNCKIEWDAPAKPITTINDPAFQIWMKEVAAMPAERQIEAVSKKLIELNPGFDGKVGDYGGKGTPRIEKGVVTGIGFVTENVVDISPVRVFAGLRGLWCYCGDSGKSRLSDLSPLAGMPLELFSILNTPVSDLSSLQRMPLTRLYFQGTQVSDLSPLRGMKLTNLVFDGTPVSDLSPLAGMPLLYVSCQGTQVTDLSPLQTCKSLGTLLAKQTKVTPASVAALQNSLPNCKIHWDDPAIAVAAQPNQPWNTPAFQAWVKATQALPAEQQIEAVSKKLMELNPGFDGKLTGLEGIGTASLKGIGTPKIENAVVREIGFITDNVTDISPVRGFVGLKGLFCVGSGIRKGRLADLSPLEGLPLTSLYCFNNPQVSDLSLLQGMKLTELRCFATQVSDLSPLQGMPLTWLDFRFVGVSDLSPLRGMPLMHLSFGTTKVTDLTPLKGMPLTFLECTVTTVSDLSPLRGMPLTELLCKSTGIANLLPLVDCKSLKSLYVNATKVTPTQVAPLQKALPNCKIEWDDPAKAKTAEPASKGSK
jgi:serine/threonine protein kinase/Leucine-rich repeat (LRR) protein